MMAGGVFLTIVTGLLWAGFGIACSHTVKKGIDFAAAMAAGMLFCAAAAWVVFPDYSVLLGGGVTNAGTLALIMIPSGMLSSAALTSAGIALRGGHHGIVWTVSQSGMILPYLFNVVFYREPLTSQSIGGIVLVVTSILLFGVGKPDVEPSSISRTSRYWFPLALTAFFLMGIHQSMTTIPSHWSADPDPAGVRIPCLYLGMSLGFLIALMMRRRLPDKRALTAAAILGSISLVSLAIFYRAMDSLAVSNMVNAAYPLAIGTSLIGFAIHSRVTLREHFSRVTSLGLLAGLAGLGLIAF